MSKFLNALFDFLFRYIATADLLEKVSKHLSARLASEEFLEAVRGLVREASLQDMSGEDKMKLVKLRLNEMGDFISDEALQLSRWILETIIQNIMASEALKEGRVPKNEKIAS